MRRAPYTWTDYLTVFCIGMCFFVLVLHCILFMYLSSPEVLLKTWTSDSPALEPAETSATEPPPPLATPLVNPPAVLEDPLQNTPGTTSMSLPHRTNGCGTRSTSSASCTVSQPPKVPIHNGGQISATQDNFITQQTSQPLVENLTIVAGPTLPAGTSLDAVLPTLVQAAVSSANTVLSSNPAINITQTPNTALLQPGLVVDEQNLQWILNGTAPNADQSVSIIEHSI